MLTEGDLPHNRNPPHISELYCKIEKMISCFLPVSTQCSLNGNLAGPLHPTTELYLRLHLGLDPHMLFYLLRGMGVYVWTSYSRNAVTVTAKLRWQYSTVLQIHWQQLKACFSRFGAPIEYFLVFQISNTITQASLEIFPRQSLLQICPIRCLFLSLILLL